MTQHACRGHHRAEIPAVPAARIGSPRQAFPGTNFFRRDDDAGRVSGEAWAAVQPTEEAAMFIDDEPIIIITR